MPPGSDGWPESLRARLAAELQPAAVLVPLIRRDELTVLLTERSAALRMHAGQVSFPGGRVEHDDPDLVATALRETHEEVGIEPHRVEVAGFLETLPTITGYAVTPVIGLLDHDLDFRLDTSEVESVFEVPLAWLMDPANDVPVVRRIDDRDFDMIEFHWQRQRIWGATAHMILALREKLSKQ